MKKKINEKIAGAFNDFVSTSFPNQKIKRDILKLENNIWRKTLNSTARFSLEFFRKDAGGNFQVLNLKVQRKDR